MLFPTYTYIYFLCAVVLVRWLLPRRAVLPFILGASYVFYLSWGPRYGLLLAGLTLVTFFTALAMERWPQSRPRWLTLGVVSSLGCLAFFKYAQFFADQTHVVMTWLGAHSPPPALDIVLPLGISFFVFQMVSYLVDVYRGAPAEKSLVQYALYISFFTQLIAGPIVRSNELVPQFKRPEAWSADRFAAGLDLLVRGFIKKLIIADNLAVCRHSPSI